VNRVGRTLRVLISDGRHSEVRQLVFGPESVFTARGNRQAKALMMFRADSLDIQMRDEAAPKRLRLPPLGAA
jgi:hypothetical protein